MTHDIYHDMSNQEIYVEVLAHINRAQLGSFKTKELVRTFNAAFLKIAMDSDGDDEFHNNLRTTAKRIDELIDALVMIRSMNANLDNEHGVRIISNHRHGWTR